MSEHSNNSILALLAGLAIGAGLGILFAPESGKKTREKLKTGVNDYADELQLHLRELKSKIQSSVENTGEQVSDRIDEIFSGAGEDVELTIAKLEAKLALLKDRLTQNPK